MALAAAGAFGATTPIVQRLAGDAGPPATAALLYAGAAGFALLPHARGAEVRLDRSWWPRVVAVGLSGAFLAPLCLAAGLQRTHGTTASLLLQREAVFTVALGALWWREPVGRRVLVAVAVIAAGGALLYAFPRWQHRRARTGRDPLVRLERPTGVESKPSTRRGGPAVSPGLPPPRGSGWPASGWTAAPVFPAS